MADLRPQTSASLQSKIPGPLPSLSPLPGLGFEEIASQNRSLKRKSKELDAKLSTLDRVVGQLSNDNLAVHREVESFRDRIELLEKVFMFVNFDELQKVVSNLGKQHDEPEAETASPKTVGDSRKITGAAIATANLVEHFQNRCVPSSSSESLHAAAANCSVLISSSESLHAAAAAAVKPAKSSKKDIKAGPVISGREDTVVAAVPAESGSKRQPAAAAAVASPVICGREGAADGRTSKEAEPLSPSSRSSTKEDNATASTLSRPKSRGMMAWGKTPPLASQAPCADPPNSRRRHGAHDFATSTDSVSAIQFQPRSKCFVFAQEYRQRNGPDSILPSFIHERLGQDGMTEEEINNIGRGAGAHRSADGDVVGPVA